jgi:hypothetical protein
VNKKRFAAGFLALGVAGLLTIGGPNAQACDTGETRADEDAEETVIDNEVTGGEIYAHGDAESGGAIGTTGETGYIEASGGPDGGHIQGNHADSDVNGRVDVGAEPSLCLADTPIAP